MAEVASIWPKTLPALPGYFEAHRGMRGFDGEVVVLVAALCHIESATATELSTRVGFTVSDDHVRELREHGIITNQGSQLYACFIPKPVPARGGPQRVKQHRTGTARAIG